MYSFVDCLSYTNYKNDTAESSSWDIAKIKFMKIFNCYLQKDRYFRESVILEAWTKAHNFTFTNLLSNYFTTILILEKLDTHLHERWVGCWEGVRTGTDLWQFMQKFWSRTADGE